MKVAFTLLFLLLSSCSLVNTKQYKNSGSSLIVTYDGVEEYRRSKDYISEKHLVDLMESEKEFIVIFAADWCRGCKLARKAIKQANLKVNVVYINVDEKWVKKLMSIMEVRQIPLMVHINKDGKTKASRFGAGKIVTYLISRF
ncbi:MAG: hypothetical protein CMF52_07000 [Legionellales bacterium]|nr:hypothetical protein [Legionellales bacterium]|tara:strand:+ start:1139 stop:1567 length:429 start_codon:yes stop_codon:yes gene_type:complete